MNSQLAGRFKGCLVGGLLGDCLGSPFEGESSTSRKVLNSYFKRHQDPNLKIPYKKYTDDTAMTLGVAESLVESRGFDAKDMALRFVKKYYAEPHRGYGANIVDVFAALRATDFKDVYAPSKLQFNGTGSYGNGGAMRVAPTALYAHSNLDEAICIAKDSALITHANRLGYNGAVLQCTAVHFALHSCTDSFNTLQYLKLLSKQMSKVEKFAEDEIVEGAQKEFVYVPALEKVHNLLERGHDVGIDEVIQELGNYVSAHESVPTAIYAFLRAQAQIEGIESENPFEKTIHYAISLGGDTDTIAAMAGNIAGAFYGIQEIPYYLQKHCEAVKDVITLAEKLYTNVVK